MRVVQTLYFHLMKMIHQTPTLKPLRRVKMLSKKKPFKSKIDDPKHVSKVYCYEKISIKDLMDIKPTIEAMTERVGKVWRCKFCGKTTPGSQRNTLSLHIESHFEGVSYRCSHCGKSCKNKGALRGHMHRHHGAVPDPNLCPINMSTCQNLLWVGNNCVRMSLLYCSLMTINTHGYTKFI